MKVDVDGAEKNKKAQMKVTCNMLQGNKKTSRDEYPGVTQDQCSDEPTAIYQYDAL